MVGLVITTIEVVDHPGRREFDCFEREAESNTSFTTLNFSNPVEHTLNNFLKNCSGNLEKRVIRLSR